MIETVVSVGLPIDEKLMIQKNRLIPQKGLSGGEKRISIVTGTHGDELEGQYVCYELQRRIRENIGRLTGIVDVYPAINPLGIDSITRGIPGFDLDMNRIFPGSEDGSMPEYIASRIINDLSGSAAVIDIHASNIFLEEIPQVRINELSRDTLVPLAYMLNSQTLKVIDCPHQEIKALSPILRRMAYAEDGAIEAVYMPLKRFIWAVQWHPELSSQTDKANAKIFEAFIMYAKLCRN